MFSARLSTSARFVSIELKRIERAVEKGSLRAQNRALIQARNEASATIRQTTALKAGYVKRKLQVIRARRGQPDARIRVRREALALSQFTGTRQTKKGISARPFKNRPRYLVRGGFLQHVKSGFKASLRRQVARPRAGQRWTDIRYPTGLILGPPLVDRFQAHLPEIQDRALEIFRANLQREIDFAIKN